MIPERRCPCGKLLKPRVQDTYCSSECHHKYMKIDKTNHPWKKEYIPYTKRVYYVQEADR